MKKNSLKIEIWKYLALFSLLILAFLWIFQVLFLNTYYEWVKTKEMKQVAYTLKRKKSAANLEQIIDNISYEKSICIEITNKHLDYLLGSSIISRGCLMKNKYNQAYKTDFILSGKKRQTYELTNPRFQNKTLSYAIKLDDDNYAFINTSLDPMDSTANILKNQLIYVTIIVLILSFFSAYFISKHISNPIVKINKTAKRLAEGKYDITFHVEEDIEEINELVNTLNYTKEELSKTESLRRDLMANVSHDLKTPLTMIKAYAEMTRDLNPNKNKKDENMDIIVEEVDRLTKLVNDILVLSKIQAEVETLKKEKFDLTELIQSIIKRYDILVEKEGYKFNFDYDKKAIINADKKKIEQVIYNLINNAINYTGEDKRITISLESTEENVLVKIIDTGKGIAPKDIPYIWDKYYKDSKKHKRETIGTGLGLSIVKNILKLHHFEYGVKSTKKKGTTFYFIVPCKDTN